MRVTYDHQEEVAKNIISFWFKPEKPVDYIAGQFTEIRLPHENVDERGDKRWFTLSSSPSDELVSITTKFSEEKSSSFKAALRQLKSGTELTLADPMGDFVLPKNPTIPLLFVAGGMGITPFHSIVKWLKDTGEQRDIHLIHAVHNEAELTFRDLFKSHSLKFSPLIKQSSGQSLTPEKILELSSHNPRTLTFISGPEPMVENFVNRLQELGLPNHRLVTDYFPGYPEI